MVTFENTAGNELRIKVDGQTLGIIDKKDGFYTSSAITGSFNRILISSDDFRKIADKIDEFRRPKSL